MNIKTNSYCAHCKNRNVRRKCHPSVFFYREEHKVPYLAPRTTKCLSRLWSNTDRWPYAPGVCSVTGMSWGILHSWLIEYSLWYNPQDLCNGIPARRGILLTITHLNHPRSDADCWLQLTPKPGQHNRAWVICLENKSDSETHLHV